MVVAFDVQKDNIHMVFLILRENFHSETHKPYGFMNVAMT